MDYWFDVLDRGLLFAGLAISLNLLVGYAGYLSLAHAAFFGLGAYTAGLVAIHLGWSFLPATLVAIAAAGVAGALVAFPALRISGEYVVLLTIAFLGVLSEVETAWIPVTGGATGLFPIPPPTIFGYVPDSPPSYFWLIAACTGLVLAVAATIGRSPFGRMLRAMREDQRATRALGKNTVAASVLIFGITAAMAGLIGSAWAHYFLFITPGSFNLNQTIFIAAIVVLGGSANLLGSLLGSLVLVLVTELLTDVNLSADSAAVVQQIIYGVALVAVMRFRPEGLLPEYAHPFRAIRRLMPGRGQWRSARGTDAVTVARPTVATAQNATLLAGGGGSAEPPVPTPAADGVILKAEGLSKAFAGIEALSKIDIELRRGTLTILVGPNGAGKTTLFNALTGDLKVDNGTVTLRGKRVTGRSPDRMTRAGLVRSFQDVRIFQRLTALENVLVAMPNQPGENLLRVFATPRSVRRSERARRTDALGHLAAVGLEGRHDVLAGNLGYGEQKLLALARLLATGCEVLLLDEPSSGLDGLSIERMLELINDICAQGRTVCIVEHNLDVVCRLVGDAFFLDRGVIRARGAIAELMQREELVASYFGS